MNTPLVKKIGKPVLIVGIAVAMACLLFPFGATTNQAHAAAKDTPADLNDAISIINAQLTQTTQSIQTLSDLGSNYSDYYTQAVDDYNANIVDPVNQWLSNLAYEAQQNIALNNPDDQNLITSAMTESINLNNWASAVANPTSISSGSGVSLEDLGINSDVVQGVLQVVKQFLQDNTSNCFQQLWNDPWPPTVKVLNPITGQLVPPPQLNCPIVA
jgi:hypothetical protein